MQEWICWQPVSISGPTKQGAVLAPGGFGPSFSRVRLRPLIGFHVAAVRTFVVIAADSSTQLPLGYLTDIDVLVGSLHTLRTFGISGLTCRLLLGESFVKQRRALLPMTIALQCRLWAKFEVGHIPRLNHFLPPSLYMSFAIVSTIFTQRECLQGSFTHFLLLSTCSCSHSVPSSCFCTQSFLWSKSNWFDTNHFSKRSSW